MPKNKFRKTIEEIYKEIFYNTKGVLIVEGQEQWIHLINRIFQIKNAKEVLGEWGKIKNGFPTQYMIGKIQIIYAPRLELKSQTVIDISGK